ncbi:hypothetical protein KY343_07200 [Candidatus Woesearchaeota archaeon]|nr:hypothetical protein [Candidatus Woesearchaeota archaeon]
MELPILKSKGPWKKGKKAPEIKPFVSHSKEEYERRKNNLLEQGYEIIKEDYKMTPEGPKFTIYAKYNPVDTRFEINEDVIYEGDDAIVVGQEGNNYIVSLPYMDQTVIAEPSELRRPTADELHYSDVVAKPSRPKDPKDMPIEDVLAEAKELLSGAKRYEEGRKTIKSKGPWKKGKKLKVDNKGIQQIVDRIDDIDDEISILEDDLYDDRVQEGGTLGGMNEYELEEEIRKLSNKKDSLTAQLKKLSKSKGPWRFRKKKHGEQRYEYPRQTECKYALPKKKNKSMGGMTTTGGGRGVVTVGMGSYPKLRKKEHLPSEKKKRRK